MKIAYIFDNLSNIGGIERILTDKMNFLANNDNNDIYLITHLHKKDFKPFFPLSEKVKVIFFDIEKGCANFIKIYQKKTEEVLINEQIDISVCIVYSAPFFFLYKCNDQSKKIAEFHTCYEYARGFTNIRQKFKKAVNERIYFYKLLSVAKKYTKFVVLSKNDLVKWKKHINQSISIPNFVEYYNEQPNNYALKNVISVGRYNGVKRLDIMLRAWAIVIKKHPDWQLDIYGDGDMRPELELIIEELQLKNNVTLNRPVNDLKSIYKQNSLFIYTSAFEGFCIVFIEAMASALPIVSMEMKGGSNGINIDRQTGLVSRRNIEEFAEKIIYAIENQNLRAIWGQNALLKSQEFTMQKIMPLWINLYNNILGKSISS